MSECHGKEAVVDTTPEPTEPADDTPEKSSGNPGAVVVVLLLLLGGGGALYWFKFRKPKADTKGSDDLDDYDYGEDDEDAMSGKPVSLRSYVEAVRREQETQKEEPRQQKKPSVLAKSYFTLSMIRLKLCWR